MEQITINDLRRAFCEMVIQAVRDFDVQPDESEPAFYWYIAGGAEILRLAEKRAEEEKAESFNIPDGPEPAGKYL